MFAKDILYGEKPMHPILNIITHKSIYNQNLKIKNMYSKFGTGYVH